MLRQLSLVIALGAFFISVLLVGLHKGFDYGITEDSGLSFSSESGYGFLTRCYFSICFLLLTFIVGKLIKKEVASQLISFSSLFFVILSYRLVYLQKNLFFESAETITNVLRITLPFDLVNFSLVIVLIITQIVLLYRNVISKSKAVTIR